MYKFWFSLALVLNWLKLGAKDWVFGCIVCDCWDKDCEYFYSSGDDIILKGWLNLLLPSFK